MGNDSKKIVLVDDESIVLSSISAFIELETDYEIITYSSPLKALEDLNDRDNIDLVISDFLMPEMNGVQFLKKIKEDFPEAPRILLTGYADKENAIKAINEADIYYYIEKPWNNDELLLIINNGIERKNLISQLKKKIAELKSIQKALIQSEKLSAIGRVTSMLMHDLKTPLTVIKAKADMLTWNKINKDKTKEIGEDIVDETDRIDAMANEITAFAKGTYKIHLNLEKIDFRKFVEEFIKPLFKIAERHSILIDYDVKYDGAVKLDKEKMSRVFNNLMRNSIDAVNAKGKISIQAKDIKNRLQLHYSNDGPPIPSEIIDTLFEPFTSWGKKEGIGLGLAICREIIQQHGGTISAENNENDNPVFIITLPIRRN